MSRPCFVVIGGPSGAGKSTAAPAILRDMLGVEEFVNADTVARGLSEFKPEEAAFHAGRVVLERMRQLAAQGLSFAYESTLSGRTLATFARELKTGEYRFLLVYLWLPSAETSAMRVRRRVIEGGHDIPDEAIRRRFLRSIRNFYHLYRPPADEWRLYDNAGNEPRLVAHGCWAEPPVVICVHTWENVLEACSE